MSSLFEPPPNARFLDATQQTVAWFWKRLQGDELELKPPFQRNPVWQERQKSSLIDTIIRGYPVPELYLQTIVTADGEEKHIVVDGQQRIRACMEFLDDGFPLADESDSLAGLRFSQLEDAVREQIFRYKFVVRALPQLGETEVREIFGRLNRNNVALNRQELRHATYWGEFITTMTSLSQHPFWVKSGLFTANDFRRMLDIEYISEVAVASLYGLQNKKVRLDYFYGAFESEFPDKTRIEETFDIVLGQLSKLCQWPTALRWSRKVDFYTLFVVLAARSSSLPFDKDELSRVSLLLEGLSHSVRRILQLPAGQRGLIDEHPAAVTYARGVRNSSDLGSRRLRSRGLQGFLWPEMSMDEIDEAMPVNPHLAKLPSTEELLGGEVDEEDEDEGEDE